MPQMSYAPQAETTDSAHPSEPNPAALRSQMQIGDIMSKEVVTARSDETISVAARKMSEHSVSCVVVVDDERIVGILTEKDLLKGVAGQDVDFHRIRVSQQMSGPVEVVAPDLPILTAGRIMEAKGIRRLPVVQDERLVGIVTQTDITRGLISLNPLRYVSDIMGTNVVTVDAEMTVHEAARVMAESNASCVLAVHRQEIAGIVTEKDLLKRVVALRKDPVQTRVVDIMSFPVVAVAPSYSILSASRKMETMRLHRLIVMDDKEVCGIVTQTDIMRAIRSAFERIESSRQALADQLRELMQCALLDMQKACQFLDNMPELPTDCRAPRDATISPLLE